MSEEVITEAEMEAASEWAWRLANVIVMGRHGVGNAAVLIDRALEARATAAEAENAKLREALGKIANNDWVENALDPQWAANIARAALETDNG